MKERKAVLDLETFYDSHCSVRPLGVRGYIEHPDFDAYLMSVAMDDGFTWVGHPKNFTWEKLDNTHIWAANAAFDETIILVGAEKGWWRGPRDAQWDCVLDLARSLGLPGNLAGALKETLGIDMDKSVRDKMKGKRWESMSEDFRKEVEEYALKDSVLALKLVEALDPKWSDFERSVSRINRRIVQRGLPIDQPLLKQNLEILSQQLFAVEQAIPWAGDKPLLSRRAFDEECIKLGIEPPASLAQTDTDAQDWIRRYGHKHKWIEAVTNWRRINALKKKLESFDAATMPDGRYYGGLLYFGAIHGRFSGSGGNLNLQNLPRNEMFGVSLRKMIKAPEGRKLVVVDLSQIEVRTLCWLTGDKTTLKEISESDDIYTAFAIRFGMWSKDRGSLKLQNPALRHTVKSMVLGLGYGCGPEKFAMISGMPLKEAEEAVRLYRNRLKMVPQYWWDLNDAVKTAYDLQIPFAIELPSGRSINFGRTKLLKSSKGPQHMAFIYRSGKRMPQKLWGGMLSEFAASGLARDIFCHHMLQLDAAGLDIILHVHDEVVIECDEADAERVLTHAVEVMSTPPDWIPDIPLSAEGQILTRYTK